MRLHSTPFQHHSEKSPLLRLLSVVCCWPGPPFITPPWTQEVRSFCHGILQVEHEDVVTFFSFFVLYISLLLPLSYFAPFRLRCTLTPTKRGPFNSHEPFSIYSFPPPRVPAAANHRLADYNHPSQPIPYTHRCHLHSEDRRYNTT